ncbi:unnamed protein product [Cylicocyclus nassatus]|uniref:Uncharacterized protein n=1 Tax=Cylicocyclus nassatus TaxID=53992 RepID=A0AA36GQ01_CYLNA|nr:unnamed protein product [Cylicocyclus nassatus]
MRSYNDRPSETPTTPTRSTSLYTFDSTVEQYQHVFIGVGVSEWMKLGTACQCVVEPSKYCCFFTSIYFRVNGEVGP